jgi:antitoxin CcdA
MHQSSKIPRKPTNITLPADLYADAKELDINISQVCETSLRERVNSARREKWAAENAAFIAEYNQRVEVEGTLLQEWAGF